MKSFRDSMLELVVQTSTNLPADVRAAVAAAGTREKEGSRAAQALEVINQNIDMACEDSGAICQDTGMPTFHVHCPVGADQIQMEEDIRWAVAEATRLGKLRPNSVDSLTGRNTGNNLSDSTPVVHFKQWRAADIQVHLILKGGGCENKNIQYSLPANLEHLGAAGRDLKGVKKCILHAIWQAQGQGCSSGFIGVAIGGDRANGYTKAKEQLFRDCDDTNPVPELAALEAEIMEEANKMAIGPMGFGGLATLLGCKIGAYNRLPASFFVSVAYNCWAYRRLGVTLDAGTGAIKEWHQLAVRPGKMAKQAGFPVTGKEVRLQTPLTEEQVRSLRVGDVVLISGPIVTGRDAIHKYLMEHDEAPADLNGAIVYHCGPVMLKNERGEWEVKAAGPTTSIREEPYQATVMKKFGIRAVIGKGGMGPKTSAGLQEHGGVYLHAIGGAAQIYARTLKKVTGVHLLEELGIPEAMWEIQCEDFPAIVTMDSHGGSLHAEVLKDSAQNLESLAPAGAK
ncbi:MAG: fumarate hydratase, class [Candidatus Sumerlaeota bacterium]|nr:fumarate hydratase, class [Candidatus Sumerlaeota bacterium]